MRPNSKQIEYQGKQFKSYTELSLYLGIAAQTIGRSVKLGHKIKGTFNYKIL